jgi:hypothetical protein
VRPSAARVVNSGSLLADNGTGWSGPVEDGYSGVSIPWRKRWTYAGQFQVDRKLFVAW